MRMLSLAIFATLALVVGVYEQDVMMIIIGVASAISAVASHPRWRLSTFLTVLSDLFAFEMRPLVGKLLSSLLIDDARDQTRKGTAVWITWRARPNEIGVNHPRAPETQDRIESGRERMHFGVSGRVHVGTTVGPGDK